MRDVRAGGRGLGRSAFFGMLLWTTAATAQVETPLIFMKNDSDGIVRGGSYDRAFLYLNRFNQQNCLEDERVTFNIDIRGSQAVSAPFHLEAWVGTACEETASRSSGLCTQVGAVGNSVEQVELFVRDLVRSTATSEVEPCASETELPTSATVYFMLLDDDGMSPSGAGWYLHWSYQYDLVPPTAPTSVQASPAEGGLHVSWEHPDAPADVRRYVFLCDPPPGADPAEALGPNELCESPELSSAEIRTPDQLSRLTCGYTEGAATSADVTPLTRDVTYAVGIVALDGFYNLSPLSNTACDVAAPPAEPKTTRTVITDRGCSIGGERNEASVGLLALLGAAALVRRRRS